MKLTNISTFLFFLISYTSIGQGGKILFLNTMGTKSHKIFFMSIAEALARKGHQVTVVSPYEPLKKIENVREVFIQNYTVDQALKNAFEQKGILMRIFLISTELCLDGLRQEQVQDLKNEKFDVIIINIFFHFCYLSFVHHFKVPFIYGSPQGLVGPFNNMVGNIDFPAISGNAMLEPSVPITFYKRLKTTFINFIYKALNEYYLESQMHSQCVKNGLCPSDMPSFSEINKNVSLAIINSVRTLEIPPRPAMPNVIFAGGAHIIPPKKLPKDLEEWIEGSGKEGFVFFSLGSALNPSFLPEKYRKILVKVFGSLKQRVLWKWGEETMPNLPKNVKLQKWLPQSDVLGHPKIKLFITHGGLLSSQEASYNGVPIIGMPVFSDQFSNMESVEIEGCGRVMDWNNLEEKVFTNLIQEVLNNKKIIENVKRKSMLMKDRLVPPDEEAAYWVEYVMRHKGAPLLMSPVRMMTWYEVYNMDVWTFIMFVTGGVLYLSWIVIKFVLKCIPIKKSGKVKRKKE